MCFKNRRKSFFYDLILRSMTLEYRGFKRVTGGYRGLQGVKGVTKGYRELQGVTSCYKG